MYALWCVGRRIGAKLRSHYSGPKAPKRLGRPPKASGIARGPLLGGDARSVLAAGRRWPGRPHAHRHVFEAVTARGAEGGEQRSHQGAVDRLLSREVHDATRASEEVRRVDPAGRATREPLGSVAIIGAATSQIVGW